MWYLSSQEGQELEVTATPSQTRTPRAEEKKWLGKASWLGNDPLGPGQKATQISLACSQAAHVLGLCQSLAASQGLSFPFDKNRKRQESFRFCRYIHY